MQSASVTAPGTAPTPNPCSPRRWRRSAPPPSPRAVAEADRIVERLAREVDAVVVGRDAQIDRGVQAREGIEAREQPAGREGADDADLERLAEAAVGVLVERRGDAVEGIGDDRDERMPFVGEREAARQAVKEARAEAAFELRDLMTDRALADAELDRGAGEVEVARRGLEGAEGVQGELGAVHSPVINYSHGFVEKSCFVGGARARHPGGEGRQI